MIEEAHDIIDVAEVVKSLQAVWVMGSTTWEIKEAHDLDLLLTALSLIHI